jgi:hypothetical protein
MFPARSRRRWRTGALDRRERPLKFRLRCLSGRKLARPKGFESLTPRFVISGQALNVLAFSRAVGRAIELVMKAAESGALADRRAATDQVEIVLTYPVRVPTPYQTPNSHEIH